MSTKTHELTENLGLSGLAGVSSGMSMPPLPSHSVAMDTTSLLAQQAAHEKARADHVAALLKESADLTTSTEARQKTISSDLKALGYVKPRAARTKKEK